MPTFEVTTIDNPNPIRFNADADFFIAERRNEDPNGPKPDVFRFYPEGLVGNGFAAEFPVDKVCSIVVRS